MVFISCVQYFLTIRIAVHLSESWVKGEPGKVEHEKEGNIREVYISDIWKKKHVKNLVSISETPPHHGVDQLGAVPPDRPHSLKHVNFLVLHHLFDARVGSAVHARPRHAVTDGERGCINYISNNLLVSCHREPITCRHALCRHWGKRLHQLYILQQRTNHTPALGKELVL